jgi:hypothetical protein
MRWYLISGAGLMGALVLMFASGSMNFMYWLTQGQSARDADILASVSVAFDIFKSVLPFSIAWAWASRKWGYVVLGSVLFALFFCFSLMSAIGFGNANRSKAIGGREAKAMQLEQAAADLERAKTELKALPLHRVAAVIEEELKGMRKDRFWNGSQSCNDPSGGEARNFCKKYGERSTEYAAALAAGNLSTRIAQLSREAEDLKTQGAGQGRDPQLAIVSLLSGLDNEGAKIAIVVFVALLVELGAAFGLFLALGHSFNHLHGENKDGGSGSPKNRNQDNQDKLPAPLPKQAKERLNGAVKPLRLKFAKGGGLALEEGDVS